MKAPPGKKIQIGYDAEGYTSLYWEVMPRAAARVIAVGMAVVATVWGTSGSQALTGLARVIGEWEKDADWLGLAINGGGSLLFVVPCAVVAFMAIRLAFSPQQERLTLLPDRFVYEPGSALLALDGSIVLRPANVVRVILGTLRVEIPRDTAGRVFVSEYKRTYSVAIESGGKQLEVGRWLTAQEREWLAEILDKWQKGG